MLFSTIDCSGTSVDENDVPLDGAGTAESTPFTTTMGPLSYKVHYDGDANYNPDDGPCEPLTVGAVGGVVELRMASGSGGGPESASPADGSTTAHDYGLPAAAIAAGALMAVTGACYAWRRSLR
jgi:hypothetical protein